MNNTSDQDTEPIWNNENNYYESGSSDVPIFCLKELCECVNCMRRVAESNNYINLTTNVGYSSRYCLGRRCRCSRCSESFRENTDRTSQRSDRHQTAARRLDFDSVPTRSSRTTRCREACCAHRRTNRQTNRRSDTRRGFCISNLFHCFNCYMVYTQYIRNNL